jgi:hypothetical protein
MADTVSMPLDPASRAQIRTLREGGMCVGDIADRLRLKISQVQQVLGDEPRRFKRGCGAGPEPAYRRGMGTL